MPRQTYPGYFGRKVYGRNERPTFAILTPARDHTRFQVIINRGRWIGPEEPGGVFAVYLEWSTNRGATWTVQKLFATNYGAVDKDRPRAEPQEKTTTCGITAPLPKGANRIRFEIRMRRQADFDGDVILF